MRKKSEGNISLIYRADMNPNSKVVPPPPPPSSSHKYILTIPVQQLPNVGFHLENLSKSSSTGEELGAKVKCIDLNAISDSANSEYRYLKRVAVGDVLYRINGELVKNSSFQYIQNLLFSPDQQNMNKSGRGATLRKNGSEYVMTLIMERQDRSNIENISNEIFVTNATSTAPEQNGRGNDAMMINHMRNNRTVEISNETASPIPKSKSGGDTSVVMPSPGDLSDEGNVLSSIFSPKFNLLSRMNQTTTSNDTSVESEKNTVLASDTPPVPITNVDSDLEHRGGSVSNPSKVPDAQLTDGEGSSFDDDDEKYFQSSSSALKYIDVTSSRTSYHYENGLSNKNGYESVHPSSPFRERCPEENDNVVDSPTFSYSVTTVNTEQHLLLDTAGPGNLLSPIGVQISEQHSFDSEATSVASRRQFYDSRVSKLRQKYSFLSPDSVKDPTGMEIGSKSCALSCSMSTVYMSPVVNTSAEPDSRLPSVSEVQEYDQGVPKQIQVSFENPFAQDNIYCESYNIADESLTNQHNNTSEELVEDMDAIVIAHAELQDQMDTIVRERDQSEQILSSQIELLETKVKDLKDAMKVQSLESRSRIESLEQSKAEAEKDMDDLRMALEHTTMDAEVLSQKLQAKEIAIGKLSGKLYKECAAAEACANALAKALTESENELLVMKEENKHSKQRISELEGELRSSRILVDKLSGEIERYKLREKDFEQFKQKFKYATKLYKSRIQDLRSIVAQNHFKSSSEDMEDSINRVHLDVPLRHAVSIKPSEKENVTKVQSSFTIHTDDVGVQNMTKKPVVSPSNGSNESNETWRQSKIRAAGGRAALRAKLKMRRQSKFEKKMFEKPSALTPHDSNIRA